MSPLERKALVDAYRAELKRARLAPRPEPTPDEQRDANARRNLRSLDRHAPRLPRNASGEQLRAHRVARARYESDIGRRGGFAAGEYLRRQWEDHGFVDLPNGSRAREVAARRMNRRFRSRTAFSGPNGVLRTITPHEMANLVGVGSRRRHVSPGLVPRPRQ